MPISVPMIIASIIGQSSEAIGAPIIAAIDTSISAIDDSGAETATRVKAALPSSCDTHSRWRSFSDRNAVQPNRQSSAP